MNIVFGNWKYVARNLWYVLPFGIVPAVMLALSLDDTAISEVTVSFFTGDPRTGFLDFLNAWSIIRYDSVLGAAFSLLAVISCIVFAALLLVFAEKHMRIGKRTASGLFSAFWHILPTAALVGFIYLFFFEGWGACLAAVLYAVSALSSTGLVYVLYVLVLLAFLFVLLYLAEAFCFMLPCKLITGVRTYDAFLYGYRLMTRGRWRIMLSMGISLAVMISVLAAGSLLPSVAFRFLAAALFLCMFLGFVIRMLTAYFTVDKLDREDILKSYLEM